MTIQKIDMERGSDFAKFMTDLWNLQKKYLNETNHYEDDKFWDTLLNDINSVAGKYYQSPFHHYCMSTLTTLLNEIERRNKEVANEMGGAA